MSIAELHRLGSAISPIGPAADRSRSTEKTGASDGEFKKILGETQQLNLSQHAETRIRSREIPWSAQMEKRVSDGISALEAKGSREALIMADGVAFIANVRSRTIVTAMDQNQMKERVFTNIDSAVLV